MKHFILTSIIAAVALMSAAGHASAQSKDELMDLWKEKGYKTKIVWWNFNTRNKTATETDEYGNIFISGYSPMLLKYLEVGFDGKTFLEKLLDEYAQKMSIK